MTDAEETILAICVPVGIDEAAETARDCSAEKIMQILSSLYIAGDHLSILYDTIRRVAVSSCLYAPLSYINIIHIHCNAKVLPNVPYWIFNGSKPAASDIIT